MSTLPETPILPERGLLRGSARTPQARTLVDVLRATVAAHPEASALEDASGALSYRELAIAGRRGRAWPSTAAGVGRGDRVGVRMPSRRPRPLRRDPRRARGGRRLRAGRRRRPGGARRTSSSARPACAGSSARAGASTRTADARDRPRLARRQLQAPHPSTAVRSRVLAAARRPTTTPGSSSPRARPARRRASPSATARPPPSSTPRRGCSCGDGRRSARPGRPRAGRALGRVRRLLRGDVARLAARRLPRARAALARAQRHADLGPWLVPHGITVVSTVPTLAGALAGRVARQRAAADLRRRGLPARARRPRSPCDGREVWNTYGPTEATVVACARPLLRGRDRCASACRSTAGTLAVVDADGRPVAEGEVGELIIGGVGLARYLDPAKDAEKYAPPRRPRLGARLPLRRPGALRARPAWSSRAAPTTRSSSAAAASSSARSRPRCRRCPACRRGRRRGAHDRRRQPGPRRLPRRAGCARRSTARAALGRLRDELPAALVPLLAVVEGDLPTRTSGKVDRAALPWPLPTRRPTTDRRRPRRPTTAAARRRLAARCSALPVDDADANFFDLGGGSLAAAQLVAPDPRSATPSSRSPTIYAHPRLGAMADELAEPRRTRGLDRRLPRTRRADAAADAVCCRPCSASRCSS